MDFKKIVIIYDSSDYFFHFIGLAHFNGYDINQLGNLAVRGIPVFNTSRFLGIVLRQIIEKRFYFLQAFPIVLGRKVSDPRFCAVNPGASEIFKVDFFSRDLFDDSGSCNKDM